MDFALKISYDQDRHARRRLSAHIETCIYSYYWKHDETLYSDPAHPGNHRTARPWAGLLDDTVNSTRFLAISRKPQPHEGEAKTSIVFTLNNQPGTLFKALSVFSLRNIDLAKIESRLQIGKPWEYLFYIDFLGAADEERCADAIKNLEEFAPMLRVLGSYLRSKPGE